MLQTNMDTKSELRPILSNGCVQASTYTDDMTDVFGGFATLFHRLARVSGGPISYQDTSEVVPTIEKPFTQLVNGGTKTTRRFQYIREQIVRFLEQDAEVGETFTMHFSVTSPSKISVSAHYEPVTERSYKKVPLTLDTANESESNVSLEREQRKCHSMYTKAAFCDSVCIPGSEITISL